MLSQTLPGNHGAAAVDDCAPKARSGRRLLGLAALCLTLWPGARAAALDPLRATTQYVIKTWSRDNGLPNSSITAVAQTRDRYLWLGTNAGLTRFDGVRFTDVTGGLIEGGVFALAETVDGTLWIATQSGHLAQLRDGKLKLQEGPSRGFYITSLLATRDGALWIATLGSGVYRLANGRFEQQRPLGYTELLTMIEDRDGVLWMGGRGAGLLRLADGRWTRYTARDGLAGETIHALHQDAAGDLWIGTSNGLTRLHRGRFRSYTRADGASQDTVVALTTDVSGNVWIGTQSGGLLRLARDRFATLSQENGLADDAVRVLLQDHERNLWVGTSNGLNRLNDGRFVTYGRPEGLTDATAHTVVEGRRGAVWVGTAAGGAYRIHDGRVTPLGVLPNANVMAVHEARDGSVWLATGDSRLFHVRNGKVSEETPRTAGGFVPKISWITEYDGELLLAGSTQGLGRLRGRSFARLHPQAPPIHFIFTVYAAPDSTLWLGTSQGLVRVSGEQYTFFTTRDGLPDDRVRAISADQDGALWLATMGGLCRLHNGTIRTLARRDGLPDALLRTVLDDRQGYLWLSSIGHVFRLSKAEIANFFDGRTARVTPIEFDTSDGLRTTEVPMSAYPGFRARDGRLWFATARGASVFDPAQPAAHVPPPPLHIEELVVDGLAESRASYPPGKGKVEIRYAALSFRAPERLRFRHKLEGLDESWVEAGDRRIAQYTNLRPRRYTFLVNVVDADGVPANKPVALSFTLETHWYQTWLFLWLVLALLASAAWGVYRLRVFELKQRYAAVLAERSRLAREMHDTLAQNLGGVAFQLDAVKMQYRDIPAELMAKLDQTSKMIRYSVSEAYRAIRDLRAQVLETRDLAAAIAEVAERVSGESGLDVQMTVEGASRRLNAIAENNVLRIVQEAITNVVTHAGAKRVTVALGFFADHLTVRVTDDGRGFDTQRAFTLGAGHYGLLGMRERVNRIGARMTLTSQSPGGTEVLVELPFKSAERKERSVL